MYEVRIDTSWRSPSLIEGGGSATGVLITDSCHGTER